jgi:hypothetical protein
MRFCKHVILNEYDPTSDQSAYNVSFSNAHDDAMRVEYLRVDEMSELIFWEIAKVEKVLLPKMYIFNICTK